MSTGKLAVMGMLTTFVAGGLLAGLLLRQSARASAQGGQPQPPGTPPAPWLKGSAEEKLAQLERHLRGLDVSMAEIGYRYGELLVAAKTRNWDYAQYQTEKIELSMRLAIERRPKRAQSSEPFLKDSLPLVLMAVKAKNGEALDTALEKLHAGCVQCHQAEKVLYFKESVDRIKERNSR
ncbi:MAG: hypothetical protein L0Y72_25725 [Gemmataceae bacterium]|nr:hypothetical protein [Gemmataceae bacterium]MCI0742447.1 hypothetical protein [Gemmataceae bacterium]